MKMNAKALKKKTAESAGKRIVAVDLFCGAGGLTRGLLDACIEVVAGYDIDELCQYPYEYNNKPAVFKKQNVADGESHVLHHSKIYSDPIFLPFF